LFDLDEILVTKTQRTNLLDKIDSVGRSKSDRFDEWTKRVEQEIAERIKVSISDKENTNPVLIMVASGARGTTTNLRHLAGMRGRLDTEYPICANLREGLHPYEFFMSAKMSRRTLVDKKLGVAYFGDYT